MTYWASFFRSALALTVSGALLFLGTGCSSSQSTTPTAQDSARTSSPTLSLLYTTAADELVLHDARREASRTLATNAEAKAARAVSPTARYLAFSYATADSSHLALLNLASQTMQRLHTVAGTVTYSLAWHPDQDRLAFGYYRPVENGTRGPGAIRVATPDGTTRSVGCQTAREVLHWLPNGSLATRNDEKLYVVAAEDCATQASHDARRMHLTHYAPDGQRMAYIHRELRYDRDAEDYVPDSSLVLSGPRGGNAETLFRDTRHVRHLRWSPDGSELALDVEVQKSGHRQLVVYDGSRPTFLISPAQTTADQVHPRWSPSGRRIAFTLRTREGTYAAARVKGQTRRLGPTNGPVWGWLDEHSVVVPGPDSVRVHGLDGTTPFTHPTPATLLHVWNRPAS